MTTSRRSTTRLEKLLERYIEEHVVRGATLDTEELCRNSPELLEPLREAIRGYERLSRVLSPPTGLEVGGSLLGHYKVLRLLGEGGMGAVYEAEDQRLGRRVALKLLPRELTEHSERRARFEREARSVAALQHPNIVTLHAIEEVDGQLFLVMELVEGTPLNRSIPAAGMKLERFFDLAIPLADAVAAAHARGITHRDLKPANVVADRDGKPRVLDFGLAKSVAIVDSGGSVDLTRNAPKDETLTREGRILGTVAYMSPEQAEGKPVDHRSDIFSLGAMLYEMATGRRPFRGETSMSVISSILRDEPESVTKVRHSFPNHAGRIIRRCLQKDPKRRYQTALDLKSDLAELREDLDSGLLDAPVAAPARPRSRWTWAAMLSLAVLAVAAVVWVVRSTELTSGGSSSKDVRRLITQGAPEQAAISPEGRYVAYESRGDGGIRTIRMLQVGTSSDVDLTGNQDPSTSYGPLHFSADGNHLFYTTTTSGSTRTLWRLPILGGQPDKLLDRILEGGVVSSDGAWVAAVRGDGASGPRDTLEVVSLEDGSVRSRTTLEGQEFRALVWGAGGQSLIAQVSDVGDPTGPGLYSLPPDGGDLGVLVPPEEFILVSDLCPQSGGELLIVSGHRTASDLQQLWRVELASGAIDLMHSDYSDYRGCSVTADGSTLVTVRRDVRSRLWTLLADGSGAPSVVTTTSGERDGVTGVAWLDDEMLVYGVFGPGQPQIWRTSVTGGSTRRLTTHGGFNPGVGRGSVLFRGGWRQPGGPGIFALPTAGDSPRRLSPEGVSVAPGYPASLSADGEWVFYEELVEDGMRLIRRPWEGADVGDPIVIYDGSAHRVEYSPDGTRFNFHALGEDGVWRTAIYPADFGPPERLLDVHSEAPSPWLDLHSEAASPWASNESIYIVRTENGTPNIYELWIETLQERQVTHFTDNTIFAFDVSPDLTTLVVARGEVTNELLLIENP